jgi:hypothetical protein
MTHGVMPRGFFAAETRLHLGDFLREYPAPRFRAGKTGIPNSNATPCNPVQINRSLASSPARIKSMATEAIKSPTIAKNKIDRISLLLGFGFASLGASIPLS